MPSKLGSGNKINNYYMY